MTKQETTTRLNDYLDGELGPAQVAAFEDALSKDPALRAELESIQAAMELLRTEGPLQAPTGFHERVMAQAAVEPMPQIGWMDRLRRFFRDLPMETLAMAVAATIVLVLVGNFLPDSGEPETEPAALQPAEPERRATAGAQETKEAAQKTPGAAPSIQAEDEIDPIREVANGLISGPVDNSTSDKPAKSGSMDKADMKGPNHQPQANRVRAVRACWPVRMGVTGGGVRSASARACAVCPHLKRTCFTRAVFFVFWGSGALPGRKRAEAA